MNPQHAANDDHDETGSNDQNQNDTVGNSAHASQDIESKWREIEKYYRRRHPNITDEDVDFKTGEFDTMTDRIAKRTNRNRKDVNDEIRDWKS